MEKENQGISNFIKKISTIPVAITTCAVLFILVACVLLVFLLIFGWKLIYLI